MIKLAAGTTDGDEHHMLPAAMAACYRITCPIDIDDWHKLQQSCTLQAFDAATHRAFCHAKIGGNLAERYPGIVCQHHGNIAIKLIGGGIFGRL
jgi:hypothetical protein